MPIVDLTIPLVDGIASYPGEPGGAFIQFASIKEQGFLSHQLLLYSHGGTHVDAPSHFLPQGSDVMAMRLDSLIGPAIVADVPTYSAEIQLSDIHWPREPQAGDRILLRTGWGSHWGQPDYFSDSPNLSIAVAQYLSDKGIALLGIEMPTPNTDEPQAIHEILLGHDIIIIEGLINLEKIAGSEGVLICLPLAAVGLDGAPARVVFTDKAAGQ